MTLRRTISSKFQGLLSGSSAIVNEGQQPTEPRNQSVERVTRDFADFFAHLKRHGFAPDVCIDVGAATGTQAIYEAFPNSKQVAFEPLPDFQAELKESLASYDHIIRECALTDEVGEGLLLRHTDLFGSSIMHGRDAGDDRVVNVRTSTLDVEMSDITLAGSVLLKTDCQGADLGVLQGGRDTLKTCDVVIVEASLFRFWGPHQPDFFDIVSFMKSEGFALYDILDGLFRPLDSALGQIDLAFVKEHGEFRAKHYW